MWGDWWCKLIHSHNNWVIKYDRVIGDANEEWDQRYNHCEVCGRNWVGS